MNKTDIVNHYYEFINKDYIRDISVEDDVEYCTKCNIEKVIYKDKGYIICPQCGQQDHYFIDSNKPSYKNPPNEVAYFSYKRINHFNEWLAQFQAKESTDIPSDVYDKIILEIKKERITNMANLTASKLREILKKLKLNKYYEHVPHIINRINGIQAPTMSRETEEKLTFDV